MFGGLAFLVHGNMCVGIVKDDLMVRVGPEAHDRLLRAPHARQMDFTGRPMKGFVYVAPEGYESDADLESWVRHGLAHVSALPRKAKTPAGKRGAAEQRDAADKGRRMRAPSRAHRH
jgi:TfoX/Sxy family transcriptional regulator of competence genes